MYIKYKVNYYYYYPNFSHIVHITQLNIQNINLSISFSAPEYSKIIKSGRFLRHLIFKIVPSE